MESVGLQYAGDEFVEGPSPVADPNRYTSPKSSGVYAPENFYDASAGSWYSGGAPGNYAQSTSSGAPNYHNVNHAQQQQHMPQQQHDHYGMSPHIEAPHMSTTPQPLPPMSSFRGNTNGPAPANNPALYNPSISHQQHNLQNDTLVGKALQTVTTNNHNKIILSPN
jgi:hypothetical protein